MCEGRETTTERKQKESRKQKAGKAKSMKNIFFSSLFYCVSLFGREGDKIMAGVS
jgi:hypothetical protein